ncbi:MAG: ABC transporter substrate-binding protein [Magnetococcus sp. WYHC-3]
MITAWTSRLLSVAAVTAALMSSGLVGAAEPIRIGTFLAVTGPASFLGDPELKTMQMYVERLNAQGGIDGRKLELVHYDTSGQTEKAQSFAKRLIKKDQVDIIVGGSTSGTSLTVIPIVEEAGIPFISLAGSIEIIQPVKKWVFKVPHTDRMAAARVFQDMKARGLTRIALISGDGGFDKSGRAQCLALAPEFGMEIVADESYGNSDTDMTAQLTKIRASNAQAVFNFGFGAGPAIVTKNMRQLGIDLPLYQSHGVASKKFIELAGAAAEGVRLPAAALLVADKLPASDPTRSVLLDYKQAYEAQFGPVSTFGGHAYDGLMIAVEAIDRANSTDRAKVRSEIENTTGFKGTAGVFNMTPEDHMGLKVESFRMLEVKNGDWALLD